MIPYFWVFLAATGGVAKDIVSKRTAVSISGILSSFASFLFPLPLYLVLLWILYMLGLEDLHIAEGFFLAIFLRAITDTVAETAKMYALASIEFTTFTTIASLQSVAVLLLSPLITGDPLTGTIVIGAVVSVCGAVLTTFNRTAVPSRRGLILSIVSLFSFALMGCFDRLSVKTASGPLSAFAMTALSALFLFPFTLRSKDAIGQLRRCARPFTLRAVLEVTNMSSKLIATQYLTAPEVSTLMRLNLFIAVIAGQKLFNEEGFFRRLAGVFLVLIGAVIVVYGRL